MGCGNGFVIRPQPVVPAPRQGRAGHQQLAQPHHERGRPRPEPRRPAQLPAPSGLRHPASPGPHHRGGERGADAQLPEPCVRLLPGAEAHPALPAAKALEKLSGSLSLGGRDLVQGGARVSYVGSVAGEVQRNVYSLPDRSMREGISEMVPAKDTFAVLSLRVEPGYLLKSIAKDVFTPGDRRLVEENVRKNTEYNDLDEFYDDLATRIGTQATIAVGRLSDVFDGVEHDGFWSEAPPPAARSSP